MSARYASGRLSPTSVRIRNSDCLRHAFANAFFHNSENTLELWLKKEKETGDYQPKLPVRIGTVPKIESLAKFQEFVTVRECVDA
ncbi:hypothetical protein [Argonema antarcticum]|uniref:hypothetical protein n=1 Tax=Argonema antarcticum TaxID=2942763 RepID=UPI002012A16D|nr:hypothetical protein [Argonema antarcticum]MCL1473473.1 hypothetical protein [Argonema antarcticum A004/B2]